MIHPHTELRFINQQVGYGVVATKLIPRGTITWVHDQLDRVYTHDEVSKLSSLMQQHLETYSFRNTYGEQVLCWDLAKYVNHSFKPSCFTTAYDFEIAIRDILPGEQLTDDYGYLNLNEAFTPLDEGTERKVVYPDDIRTYHNEWDELIKCQLPYIFEQRQPLLPYIPKETWTEFLLLKDSPEMMRSILTCHYAATNGEISKTSNANETSDITL